ncbi:hypothetical protein HY500_02740 [Candidatus Woesearchaeota archaeon]|nr:hypothetical protein [Candidatus Woesearchaeota archaeon]
MGTAVEFKDTLRLAKGCGFPLELDLEQHIANPEKSRRFLGHRIRFEAEGKVVYNHSPARVFLVEDVESRWLYWGNGVVVEQAIKGGVTRGVCLITKIYDPEFQRHMTVEESPVGKSYFNDTPKSLLDVD